MTRFNEYSETISIDGDDYKLLPLDGEDLAIIFRIIGKVNPEGKTNVSEEELGNLLDESVIKDMHYVCYKTLKNSYPETDDAIIKRFVTRNLYSLYPKVMEINISRKDE